MKIAAKLSLVAVLGALIIAPIVSTAVYFYAQSILQERLARAEMDVAKGVMREISQKLLAAKRDIRMMSEDEFLQEVLESPDSGEIHMVTEELEERMELTGPWDAILVLDKNGHPLIDLSEHSGHDETTHYPLSTIAFRAALSGGSYYSDLVVSDHTGKPTVIYAIPISASKEGAQVNGKEEQARINGVIIGHLNWSAVHSVLGQIDPKDQVHLFNRYGKVIAGRSGDKHQYHDEFGQFACVQQALRVKSAGYCINEQTEGYGASLAVYAPQQGVPGLQGKGWRLMLELPYDEVFAPVQRLAWTTATIITAALMLLAAIFLVGGRRIVSPIHRLTEGVRRIAKGDFAQRLAIHSRDELGDLASSFNNMAEVMQKTTVSRDYVDNIIKSMMDSLVVVTPAGLIERVNQKTLNILGYKEDELIGKPADILFEEEEEEEEEEIRFKGTGIADLIKKGMVTNIEKKYVTKDGRKVPVLFSGSTMHDADGEIQGLVCVALDITERKQAEKHIEHLAYYDPLTDLPNRKLFSDRLTQNILRAKRNEQTLALLYIDLDHFKNINDSLGHPVGDMLLKAVAELLSENLRKSTTVSRLGGDEFAIIIEDISTPLDAINVADKVIDLLRTPLRFTEHEIFVSASIGIAIYPNDGGDFNALLKNADTAMYHAKKQGRNNYQFYSAEMNAELEKKMSIEAKLRRALDKDEFILNYQPQVDLEIGEITGVEALIRWYPDGSGPIPPAEFIPVAEETGLILEVDKWVMLTACTQMRHWHEVGFKNRRISVNISGFHFRRARILETVDTTLKETGLKPDCLEIEITESVLMENVEEAISTLEQLRSRGIHIAVDDFGTGYSSLNYLKRLPINKIKIDRSFISDVTTDPDNAAITRTIIAMAQNLNREVIAEGVETKEQLDFLHAEGCNQVQGYYFAKPLSADAFNDLIVSEKYKLRGRGY